MLSIEKVGDAIKLSTIPGFKFPTLDLSSDRKDIFSIIQTNGHLQKTIHFQNNEYDVINKYSKKEIIKFLNERGDLFISECHTCSLARNKSVYRGLFEKKLISEMNRSVFRNYLSIFPGAMYADIRILDEVNSLSYKDIYDSSEEFIDLYFLDDSEEFIELLTSILVDGKAIIDEKTFEHFPDNKYRWFYSKLYVYGILIQRYPSKNVHLLTSKSEMKFDVVVQIDSFDDRYQNVPQVDEFFEKYSHPETLKASLWSVDSSYCLDISRGDQEIVHLDEKTGFLKQAQEMLKLYQ